MAYSFETADFCFTSNNPHKVETVKRWFTELGYTVESIKSKSVPDRHKLMTELTCWGHCSLAFDYWKARDLKQTIYNNYVDQFPKLSSRRVFAKGLEGHEHASQQVEKLTGWKL